MQSNMEAWAYDNVTGSLSWKYRCERVETRSKICKTKSMLDICINKQLITVQEVSVFQLNVSPNGEIYCIGVLL